MKSRSVVEADVLAQARAPSMSKMLASLFLGSRPTDAWQVPLPVHASKTSASKHVGLSATVRSEDKSTWAKRLDGIRMDEDGDDILTDYIIPIGPFCPFKSPAWETEEGLKEDLIYVTEDFLREQAVEMSRLQLDASMGNAPSREKILEVSDQVMVAEKKWRKSLERLKKANDYQLREKLANIEALANHKGTSMDVMAQMMKWQAESMKDAAMGRMPKPPPPQVQEVTQKLMEKQKETGMSPADAMDARLDARNAITSLPFTGSESAFNSDVVKEEYKKLIIDHQSLIKLGAMYGSFDSDGKLGYIDSMQAIEDRWDTFFARFSMMGQLNTEFDEQVSSYLKTAGLTPKQMRRILRNSNDVLRKQAQREDS